MAVAALGKFNGQDIRVQSNNDAYRNGVCWHEAMVIGDFFDFKPATQWTQDLRQQLRHASQQANVCLTIAADMLGTSEQHHKEAADEAQGLVEATLAANVDLASQLSQSLWALPHAEARGREVERNVQCQFASMLQPIMFFSYHAAIVVHAGLVTMA